MGENERKIFIIVMDRQNAVHSGCPAFFCGKFKMKQSKYKKGRATFLWLKGGKSL